MKHIMQLTRRHLFPKNEGTIYPSDTGHLNKVKNFIAVLDAWFDMFVPDDTTELVVYMSGFDIYKRHLRKTCREKGIKLTERWIIPKHKESEGSSRTTQMNPNAYRDHVYVFD